MTTAADYLQSIIDQTETHAPSITMTTSQRDARPPGLVGWKPGITSYGWGVNGRILNQSTSLRFDLLVWYSDRGSISTSTPAQSIQFPAGKHDKMRITLERQGNDVEAAVDLLTWGSSFTSNSFMFEDHTQQILFIVPGAGPHAPPALMSISLHPTGAMNLFGDVILNPIDG